MRGGSGQHMLDEVKQSVGVVLVADQAQLQRIQPRQLPQLRRQLLRPQRPGTIDQYGDHPHRTLQRRLDLEPYKVVGVL